jgi:hypothetical protein
LIPFVIIIPVEESLGRQKNPEGWQKPETKISNHMIDQLVKVHMAQQNIAINEE